MTVTVTRPVRRKKPHIRLHFLGLGPHTSRPWQAIVLPRRGTRSKLFVSAWGAGSKLVMDCVVDYFKRQAIQDSRRRIRT